MKNKVYQLFVGKNSKENLTPDLSEAKNSYDGLSYRIPSLICPVGKDGKQRVLAMCDISECGMDHGRIQTVLRISDDNAESFDEMKTVLSPPVKKAPQCKEDYASSFAIDPIMCQADSGDILMVVDVFPESKAIMQKQWLETGSGYIEAEGKRYLALYPEKFKAEGGAVKDKRNGYTVREHGWIYTPEGEKTKYYLPAKHSEEYAYETMGDMYYAVDGGEFIDTCPPMFPTKETCRDIYVGNVFLNSARPVFSLTKPERVEKRTASPDKTGDGYSAYPCVETKPAPLSMMPTLHLFMMKSSDMGDTWSQPVDITPQVKRDDEIFIGTGPGVAIKLQYQKDKKKNGRILVPVYNLKDTFALYTDDEGVTWHRSECSKNIDETQFIESEDGTIFCFGRQVMLDKTPLSISRDGGETWEKAESTGLSAVRCQKSFLLLPPHSEEFPYAEGMDKSKRYIVASCPSGNYQKKSVRYGGILTLGEINGDEIRWLRQKRVITEGISGKENNFYAYSSLDILKNGEIVLLYEALPSSFIAVQKFTLEEIAGGEKAFGFPLPLITRIRRRFRKW
ncbi:MAG: exo-alpha-sialidase [Clostridia bacterium]|nr:exo-alpha-sialidase [Clostridia bacterium]